MTCTIQSHANYRELLRDLKDCVRKEQEDQESKVGDQEELHNHATDLSPGQGENTDTHSIDETNRPSPSQLYPSTGNCSQCVNANEVPTLGSSPEDIDISGLDTGATVPRSAGDISTPNGSHQGSQPVDEAKEPTPRRKYRTVCRFYKKGICKYGRKGKNCPFSHPKVCANFRNHGHDEKNGCRDGYRYKDFHPSMCKYSLKFKVYTSKDCKYPHVTGTKKSYGQQQQQSLPKVE
ncbi:hypothetical protein Pcinc_007111 [Petrolisthes cinctipes]|uniref:C3H1-type domain-containing protein n=1 Tax=Petrolisthes cinctipes TaxID=88211 RepID=A0AAE1FU01_PETCI|nr:hypothetical protein Pcinc_015647 [Petrolisthes cinctipes]KAK3888845.1 hypothetical protein Pcinc_007111 [Petrolisthes cinctipes]